MQKNLWKHKDIEDFYAAHKGEINNFFKSIIFGKIPQPQNYKGIVDSDGKPFTPNMHYIWSYNYNIFFSVISDNINNEKVAKVNDWYPALPTILAGYANIESTFDNRSNLLNSNTSFKGLVQIGSKFSSAYLDLSDTVPEFIPIPTDTAIGNEPKFSVYNAYSSAERVLVHLNNSISLLNKIAIDNKLTPNNNQYPVAGWASWILWNQGRGNGSRIIKNYILNPDSKIKILGHNNVSNISSPSHAQWVESLRLKMNIVQYIACNNCLERVYKNQIEQKYNTKIKGSDIQKTNLDCIPLTSSEYGTAIGSYVTRKL